MRGGSECQERTNPSAKLNICSQTLQNAQVDKNSSRIALPAECQTAAECSKYLL